MEKLNLSEDIVVFGDQVVTFPQGIGETFDQLAGKIPEGRNRPWYGISWMEGGKVIYYAVTAERYPGEAVQHVYEILEIEKGMYVTVSLRNWQSKTDKIKDIFQEMMDSGKTDNGKPCIEWYKSPDEMICMMKAA